MATVSVDIDRNLLEKLDQLSREQKQLVVRRLIDALFDNPEETVEQAWVKELRRRQADLDAGRAKLIPGPEAMAKLREKFA